MHASVKYRHFMINVENINFHKILLCSKVLQEYSKHFSHRIGIFWLFSDGLLGIKTTLALCSMGLKIINTVVRNFKLMLMQLNSICDNQMNKLRFACLQTHKLKPCSVQSDQKCYLVHVICANYKSVCTEMLSVRNLTTLSHNQF